MRKRKETTKQRAYGLNPSPFGGRKTQVEIEEMDRGPKTRLEAAQAARLWAKKLQELGTWLAHQSQKTTKKNN